MASTYTTNNGLLKPGEGEMSNTWGGEINSKMTDFVDVALDGVVTLSLTGTTHALAITDGVASDGRNRILLCTGSLSANNTITLSPNDAEKYFFIYNGTTGGYSVVFAQGGGSGSTVTIANGYWAIVRCDGTGTNANVTRVLDSLEIGGTLKAAGLTVTSALTNTDGSASAPAYSFSSDTNTGLFRVGSDSLGVSAGGTLRVTIDTTGVTLTLPLLNAAGSASAPSVSFSGDPNTGMYSVGADQVGIATGGTLRETVSTTAITSTLPLLGAAGSASAPQYSFSGDTNSGVFSGGADIVAISTGGTERARVDASGNFGIGGSPAVALDVIRSAADCQGRFYTGSADLRVYAFHAGAGIVGTQSAHPLILAVNGLVEAVRIATDGKVGVGTNGPTQALAVNGQGVFADVAVTYNPNDSAGNCVRVGFDSGTTRGYVTSSDGAAGRNAMEVAGTHIVLDPGVGGVVIGAVGTTPGPSAGLQLTSTSRAFQLASMTTTQRDALTAADGMIVYNSTTGKFQGRASGAWVDLH